MIENKNYNFLLTSKKPEIYGKLSIIKDQKNTNNDRKK